MIVFVKPSVEVSASPPCCCCCAPPAFLSSLPPSPPFLVLVLVNVNHRTTEYFLSIASDPLSVNSFFFFFSFYFSFSVFLSTSFDTDLQANPTRPVRPVPPSASLLYSFSASSFSFPLFSSHRPTIFLLRPAGLLSSKFSVFRFCSRLLQHSIFCLLRGLYVFAVRL